MLQLLCKLCKITPNITVGANHKFFTLTLNGLKAIASNQGNHVEQLLVVAIPTSIRNNYEGL